MYINVRFKNSSGALSSMQYSYRCNIEGISIGDTVLAPTARGDSTAVVTAINVPESKIDERIFGQLKEITQRKEAE